MEVTLASTVSANKNLDEDANTNTELLKHSCHVLLLYLMPRTTSRNGKSVSVDDQTLNIATVTAATWYHVWSFFIFTVLGKQHHYVTTRCNKRVQ